ncbi:hypothetical protein A6D6_03482 [Alcanivorax xiamenensis]|uniref:Uncharacterized protein n=1 Tax=Alcanivorax xiamenensis TaxID=1177156 RepID=A0ABQ6Y4C0_9GAMM|nr:hypothetical protein A6D6_03482 [Alcanivorax xiamenensis]
MADTLLTEQVQTPADPILVPWGRLSDIAVVAEAYQVAVNPGFWHAKLFGDLGDSHALFRAGQSLDDS